MDSIPKAALRMLYNCTEEYVLVLWLDQEPHAEIKEETKADFSHSLAKWKKNILPTLERSEYKIYVRNKKKIIESDI